MATERQLGLMSAIDRKLTCGASDLVINDVIDSTALSAQPLPVNSVCTFTVLYMQTHFKERALSQNLFAHKYAVGHCISGSSFGWLPDFDGGSLALEAGLFKALLDWCTWASMVLNIIHALLVLELEPRTKKNTLHHLHQQKNAL